MCYKCQGSWQSSPCHFHIYHHRTRGNSWVKHCYGSVRLRRSSVYGCRHPGARHWELLTSRGWKGLIEHIMQCMYNLYGPSWGPVTWGKQEFVSKHRQISLRQIWNQTGKFLTNFSSLRAQANFESDLEKSWEMPRVGALVERQRADGGESAGSRGGGRVAPGS